MRDFDDRLARYCNEAGVANEHSGRSDEKGWKFRRFTPGKSLAQCLLTLLIAGASALFWLAPTSSAQTVTVGGSMEGNLAINPGDTILAGYDITMPGMHPAATVTVSDGMVQMNVVCIDGSAQTASYVWRSTDHGKSFHLSPGTWHPTANLWSLAREEATRHWPLIPLTGFTSPTCKD